MNAEKEDLRDNYTVLICKDSPLERQKAIEKLAQDTRFSMLFQKNTLVNTGTIINLGKAFIEYTKDKYNRLWMLLCCDNLAAYASNTMKSILQLVKY